MLGRRWPLRHRCRRGWEVAVSEELGPLSVSILREGPYLIASIHTALDDSEVRRFQDDLIRRIGTDRARGVIIDVAALDVVDSFVTRTLRGVADMVRLRGALTVIVGFAPEVALAMVELGLGPVDVPPARDLEDGLAYLNDPLQLRTR